jgi:hypothetical protein
VAAVVGLYEYISDVVLKQRGDVRYFERSNKAIWKIVLLLEQREAVRKGGMKLCQLYFQCNRLKMEMQNSTMFERAVAGVSDTVDTASSPVQFACGLGKRNDSEKRFIVIVTYLYIYKI